MFPNTDHSRSQFTRQSVHTETCNMAGTVIANTASITGLSLIQDTTTVRHAMLLHAPERGKRLGRGYAIYKVHSDSRDVKNENRKGCSSGG